MVLGVAATFHSEALADQRFPSMYCAAEDGAHADIFFYLKVSSARPLFWCLGSGVMLWELRKTVLCKLYNPPPPPLSHFFISIFHFLHVAMLYKWFWLCHRVVKHLGTLGNTWEIIVIYNLLYIIVRLYTDIAVSYSQIWPDWSYECSTGCCWIDT